MANRALRAHHRLRHVEAVTLDFGSGDNLAFVADCDFGLVDSDGEHRAAYLVRYRGVFHCQGIFGSRFGVEDLARVGKLLAVDLGAFEGVGEVFVGRRHHEVALTLVAALEGQAATVVAYSHGEVGKNVLEALGIVDRCNYVGNGAFDCDLGILALSDVELGAALEPTLVERCRHRVAGPCLGHIVTREQLYARRHVGNTVVFAHQALRA